jgi:hypothetical protein
MDFRDEHVFNAPIDVVWEMFSDPDSHTTKFESMGHRDIEILEAETSETTLHLKVRRLVDVDLPGFAKKFLKPTNTVTTTDDWSRADDGSYRGKQLVATEGAPIKISAETALIPAGDQTRYEVTVHVEVKVPLVGGKLSDFAKGITERQLDQEFSAGDLWLEMTA